MKASIILRRTKERMLTLNRGTSAYICDNIWHVTMNEPRGRFDERRITRFIDKLLGGRFSLVEWLIDKGHIKTDPTCWSYDNTNYLGDVNWTKLQATRMAWLDYLIAHYEAKGD